jgi:hypothetical protein
MTPVPRAVAAVGHAFGQASEEPSPPLALRIVLRIGLGVSLFVCVSALRHALDSDITRAIAAWGDAPLAERYAPPSAAIRNPRSRRAPGPPALEWMQSDLHYFTNPDKDAVRRRVEAYKAAGAIEVYIGNVMQSGPMHIADELLVELPDDEDQRSAIMAEYERSLHSSFGGFAPQRNKPVGSILRVAP